MLLVFLQGSSKTSKGLNRAEMIWSSVLAPSIQEKKILFENIFVF